jgi:transposase
LHELNICFQAAPAMSGATATRATGCSWEVVIWKFRTGAPWRDLLERFGDWKNIHKRFSRWAESGVWESLF